MADGGKVIIKIDGDSSGFKSKMGGLKKVAGVAFKGVAIGATATATAIGAIGVAAVKSFAEYEQLVGGVETLFKESANIVKGYADQAYKTAGMSANEYMSTITSFSASLLQSLGGDTKKAAEYGNQAVIDMSDNANKMGTAIERIQDAYQGFAKQNYTMLDNLKLGYGGTKTEMERLLKDAEKLSGLKFNIDSFADVTQAIHIIQTEMGITGTTAKEAASTIQGSASMMKSAWNNLMTGISDDTQDFDKLLDNFIDSVKIFAGNLLPAVKKSLSGIGKLIEKGINNVMKNSDKIIGQVKSTLISFIKSITNAIPQIKPLGDALEFVINNLKQLTIAVIAAVATYKTLMIINAISNAYKAAVPAITAYTVATQASQHTSVLMATTMKPLELLFGVLTGKIQLQTAATIALAAAKKLLTNHMGLVVAAVGAAVVGISAYIASQARVLTETGKLIEQSQKRQKVLAEEKKAYEELKQSQIEQASADYTQVANTEILYDELKTLVDANGKVNDSNKARVDFILGELNEAYGTEYKQIDGVIKGYQDMQTEIDNLIQKKKYEIVQKAALPLYEKAVNDEVKNRIKAEQDLQRVQEQSTKVERLYLDAFKGREEAYDQLVVKQGMSIDQAVRYLDLNYEQAQKIRTEETALKNLSKTYNISSQQIIQAQKDKLDYQKAETLASQGLFNDAIDTLAVYTGGFRKKLEEAGGDITKQRKLAEDEFKLAESAVNTYLDNVTKGVEEYDEGTLRRLISYASEVRDECIKLGANVPEGMTIGVEGTRAVLIGSVQNMVNTVKDLIKGKKGFDEHSPSKWSEEVFAYVIDGAVNGLERNKNKLLRSTKKLVEDTQTEVRKVEAESNKLLLESEIKYEKALEEREKRQADKQLKQRLANAKDETEREEIQREHLYDIFEEWEDKKLDKLKSIADKERKIYDALQKDIEEWQNSAIDTLTQLAEQSYDKIEELEEVKKSFSDKLKDYGDLYTTETGKSGKEYVNLSDLSKQTDALEEYSNALLDVKAKGKVPKEFFSVLRDLSVEEGTKFAKELLKMDDKAFGEYIRDWEEKQKKAEEIAEIVYADETNACQEEITDNFKKFNADLETQGKQNAEAWGSAFYKAIQFQIPSILNLINSSFGDIIETPSYAYSGGGVSSEIYGPPSPNSPTKVIHNTITLNGRVLGENIVTLGNQEAQRTGTSFYVKK